MAALLFANPAQGYLSGMEAQTLLREVSTALDLIVAIDREVRLKRRSADLPLLAPTKNCGVRIPLIEQGTRETRRNLETTWRQLSDTWREMWQWAHLEIVGRKISLV